MLSQIFLILLSFFLFSCSLFKQQKPLDQNNLKLISYLKAVGEGRGRLGFEEQQHLFSFDAILKENTDWLLAVSIPLHGEEVLIFPNLKSSEMPSSTTNSLGSRIEQGISEYLKSKKQSSELTGKFLKELRSMIRLSLHRQLGIKVDCQPESCEMEGQTYKVSSTSKQLLIKKLISEDHRIELVGENLTESFFSKMSFSLHSEKPSDKPKAILSLELFWR